MNYKRQAKRIIENALERIGDIPSYSGTWDGYYDYVQGILLGILYDRDDYSVCKHVRDILEYLWLDRAERKRKRH